MTTNPPELTAAEWKALKEPFAPHMISWRPVAFNREKTRALVVPYYDARMVIIRLDEVVGPENWMVSHEPLPGGGVLTSIAIRDGDHWITKEDIGYIDRDTDRQTGEMIDSSTKIKGDASDGIKRAGMLWGIGRVYWMFPQEVKDSWWVDWDAQSRTMAGPPPKLPSYALPYPKSPDEPENGTNGDTGDQDSGEMAENGENGEEPAKLPDRPYDPETLRERLAGLIEHFETTGESASKSKMGLFMGMLRHAFESRGFEDANAARKVVLAELFGVDTGTALTDPAILAGLKWADPYKNEENKTVPTENFIEETVAVYMIGGDDD